MTKQKKWIEAILKAKEFINDNKNKQMKVARVATEVCEIKHGGNNDSTYTVSRFAENIKVTEKTLYSWIYTYKNIYLKLNEKQRETYAYSDLNSMTSIVPAGSTKKHVQAEYHKRFGNKGINKDFTIFKYGKAIRAACKFLNDETNLYAIENRKILAEIRFYADWISHTISKLNIEPTENNSLLGDPRLAYFTIFDKENPEPGNYVAKDGRIKKITVKDIKIFNYLKKRKTFASPTNIGLQLSNHNPGSASAWSGRSLSKFIDLELVERNKDGYYRVFN